MWRIFKKKLLKYSRSGQLLKAQWEPLWIGDQVDGCGWSAWYPLGSEGYVWYQKETAFLCTVSYKWKLSLHVVTVKQGTYHFYFSSYAEGFQVAISFPLRCFASSFCLPTLWPWNQSCVLFCVSKMGDNIPCETKSQRKSLWKTRHPPPPLWYRAYVLSIADSVC